MTSFHAAKAALLAVAIAGLPPVVLAQVKPNPAPRPAAPAKAVAEPRPPVQFDGFLGNQRLRLVRNPRDTQVRYYMEQLRPVLQVEYHRLRTTCGLTEAERRSMAREAVRIQGVAAQKTFDALYGPRSTLTTVKGINDNLTANLEQQLVELVKTTLGDEQGSRYEEELERRRRDLRDSALRMIVVELDQELFLSAGQRDEILTRLNSFWDASWLSALDGTSNLRTRFATLSRYVVPVLTDSQRSAWILRSNGNGATTRRVSVNLGVNAVAVEDEELLEAWRAEPEPNPGARPPRPIR